MWLEALEVHHLWFTCTARTEVHLGRQAGAQLRGALWESLQTSISDTELLEHLMSLEVPRADRGQNPARPFSIRPPIDDDPGKDRLYPAHHTFTFGVSLFGVMSDLFPYIVQAIDKIGEIGVGYRRGQFTLNDVQTVNPLTGQEQTLLVERRIVDIPKIPVTASLVAAHTHALPTDEITLNFLTPTQLTGHKKKLLSQPQFARLIARIIERAQNIAGNYTEDVRPREEWRDLHLRLQEQTADVTMPACDTRWINVRSGSRRENAIKKISGFVGTATFSGPLTPFLPWLVWGQSLQVGKNTVKGDGWYEII